MSASASPRCPSLEEAARILERKRWLAHESYPIDDGRPRFSTEPVLTEAYHLFGRLQRIDESVPAPSNAYRAIMESIPGVVACMHLEYYSRGKLKNEMFSLEGPGGIGKTSYVWYLARFLDGILINDETGVAESLKSLLKERRWVPILVFDDIASIISKYWILYRSERKWASLFKAIEYSKDWSGVIVFTARSFEGIAKRFRELSSFQGTYRRVLVGEYIVDIIEWKKPGRKLPYYIDVLWPGLDLPDDVFRGMLEKRRERALKLIAELESG